METKYYVRKTKANTWKSKTGAPNLHFDSECFNDLKSARQEIQNTIAKICSEKNVENIYWNTKHVDISYNYGEWPDMFTEEILSMDIMVVDGEVNFANIGGYSDET